MGCLFAIFAEAFPRLALFIIWLVRPRFVDAAFDTWIWPLLGIIFLPFTTLMYVILYTPGIGLVGWEWFWVIFAGVLDLSQLSASNRRLQCARERTPSPEPTPRTLTRSPISRHRGNVLIFDRDPAGAWDHPTRLNPPTAAVAGASGGAAHSPRVMARHGKRCSVIG